MSSIGLTSTPGEGGGIVWTATVTMKYWGPFGGWIPAPNVGISFRTYDFMRNTVVFLGKDTVTGTNGMATTVIQSYDHAYFMPLITDPRYRGYYFVPPSQMWPLTPRTPNATGYMDNLPLGTHRLGIDDTEQPPVFNARVAWILLIGGAALWWFRIYEAHTKMP